MTLAFSNENIKVVLNTLGWNFDAGDGGDEMLLAISVLPEVVLPLIEDCVIYAGQSYAIRLLVESIEMMKARDEPDKYKDTIAEARRNIKHLENQSLMTTWERIRSRCATIHHDRRLDIIWPFGDPRPTKEGDKS